MTLLIISLQVRLSSGLWRIFLKSYLGNCARDKGYFIRVVEQVNTIRNIYGSDLFVGVARNKSLDLANTAGAWS